MPLTNRAALVTGGAQGIGRAVAERFIDANATGVALVDLNEAKVKATAEEIAREHGGIVLPLVADVAIEQQVQEAVKVTLDRFGRIDILVNNAGVCPITPWDEVTLESWNRILSVNLTGAFLFSQAVLPAMQANHYGRIIFVSSIGAFTGSLVAHVAYGVSKAGLLTLMKSVAKGFAKDGILANAVAPGPVDTPLAKALGEDWWAAADQQTLLKRHASPDEIADVVLFFAGGQSTYITGQVLTVSGGMDLA